MQWSISGGAATSAKSAPKRAVRALWDREIDRPQDDTSLLLTILPRQVSAEQRSNCAPHLDAD
jgi:hypothetical protein